MFVSKRTIISALNYSLESISTTWLTTIPNLYILTKSGKFTSSTGV